MDSLAKLRDEFVALREQRRLLHTATQSIRFHQEESRNELDQLKKNATDAVSLLALRRNEVETASSLIKTALSVFSAKESDASELMIMLGDIKSFSKAREDAVNLSRNAADVNATEISRRIIKHEAEASMLSREKSEMQISLHAVKNQLEKTKACNKSLTAELFARKQEVSTHIIQLEVEKNLRAKAEEKEKEERLERIALSAQVTALIKEHANATTSLKKENEVIERTWRVKCNAQQDIIAKQQETISVMTETVTCLRAEQSSLKDALDNNKRMSGTRIVEENRRLRRESKILKERLFEAETRAAIVAHAEDAGNEITSIL